LYPVKVSQVLQTYALLLKKTTSRASSNRYSLENPKDYRSFAIDLFQS
jgi:hypothetical protein